MTNSFKLLPEYEFIFTGRTKSLKKLVTFWSSLPFYQACLDRDEIEDFFGRQAATTAIIDRYETTLRVRTALLFRSMDM